MPAAGDGIRGGVDPGSGRQGSRFYIKFWLRKEEGIPVRKAGGNINLTKENNSSAAEW